MHQKIKWAVGIAGIICSIQLLAAPVVISGVKLEDTIVLQNTNLQLNGVGIRYKAVFKGFVAGLYLSKKASTTEAIYAMPGPKRMSITMLRDLDAKEFSKVFIRSFSDNAPKDEMSKLIPGLLQMSQLFSNQAKFIPGDTILIDWVPGVGTILTVKGKVLGQPLKETAFYNAMLGIWLGPTPIDWVLKDALLGKTP